MAPCCVRFSGQSMSMLNSFPQSQRYGAEAFTYTTAERLPLASSLNVFVPMNHSSRGVRLWLRSRTSTVRATSSNKPALGPCPSFSASLARVRRSAASLAASICFASAKARPPIASVKACSTSSFVSFKGAPFVSSLLMSQSHSPTPGVPAKCVTSLSRDGGSLVPGVSRPSGLFFRMSGPVMFHNGNKKGGLPL